VRLAAPVVAHSEGLSNIGDKILPSPISPVRAAFASAPITSSRRSSGATVSGFTFGSKST